MEKIKEQKIYPKTRICSECNKEKDLNSKNFTYVIKTDYYYLICTKCQYVKNRNNREEKRKNIIHPETQTCSSCGIKKQLNINNFKYNSITNYYNPKCKVCTKKVNDKYHEEHKEEIKERRKQYRKNNQSRLKEYHKQYRKDNKEKTKAYRESIKDKREIYLKENDKKLKQQHKEYREKNKEKLRENNIKYKKEHKKERREYDRQKRQEQSNNDPKIIMRKLRVKISGGIRAGLKENGSSKNGKSCSKYLPYTWKEFKIHIESLFESWMSWDNWKKYNPETWDDNDSSTWTWNLDHIIPHSEFKYISMEDESFRQCWALSNLRPYSAKQNILDGATRIRHKKVA